MGSIDPDVSIAEIIESEMNAELQILAPEHDQRNPSKTSARRTYDKPTLVSYGSIAELTKGGGLSGADQVLPMGGRVGGP